jgi:hypothetical protein
LAKLTGGLCGGRVLIDAQIAALFVAEFVQKSAGLFKKQQLTGLFCERDHSVVPQTPFEWKAELGSAFNTAYNAQLGNVTYYVTSRDYGHPAYLEVCDPREGLKRLDLGNYHKIGQAKQACERHYAAGCDVSRAAKISR